MQYTVIFSALKIENFTRKKMIFLIFLLKTYIVGTCCNRLAEAVLTRTHNVCFGSKIRKLGIPLQTPFYYAPNFEESEGAYWFGSVRPVVCSESVMRE